MIVMDTPHRRARRAETDDAEVAARAGPVRRDASGSRACGPPLNRRRVPPARPRPRSRSRPRQPPRAAHRRRRRAPPARRRASAALGRPQDHRRSARADRLARNRANGHARRVDRLASRPAMSAMWAPPAPRLRRWRVPAVGDRLPSQRRAARVRVGRRTCARGQARGSGPSAARAPAAAPVATRGRRAGKAAVPQGRAAGNRSPQRGDAQKSHRAARSAPRAAEQGQPTEALRSAAALGIRGSAQFRAARDAEGRCRERLGLDDRPPRRHRTRSVGWCATRTHGTRTKSCFR